MDNEIQNQLKVLAIKRSIPFCYQDYIECPKGKCPKCGSDDLMRMMAGVGCDWGTDWIIKSILESELESVDMESEFEEYVGQCYPETTIVGWMELDTVTILKEQDPISWRCALSDWESMEVEEGSFITFDNGSNYYRVSDIEELLHDKEV